MLRVHCCFIQFHLIDLQSNIIALPCHLIERTNTIHEINIIICIKTMLSGLGLQLLQSVVRRNGTAKKKLILLLELRKKKIKLKKKNNKAHHRKGN